MPQNVESLILNSDKIPENECKQIPLKFSRTLTFKNESLTVIMICLKWTFKYNFCVRVTAHPQGSPNVSKQLDLDDHHPLLRSSTDALSLYTVFTEPN